MEDHRAILLVLADYFNGLYLGDTELLRSVFHPQAALFADLEGQAYHKHIDAWLDGVARRPSPDGVAGEPGGDAGGALFLYAWAEPAAYLLAGAVVDSSGCMARRAAS